MHPLQRTEVEKQRPRGEEKCRNRETGEENRELEREGGRQTCPHPPASVPEFSAHCLEGEELCLLKQNLTLSAVTLFPCTVWGALCSPQHTLDMALEDMSGACGATWLCCPAPEFMQPNGRCGQVGAPGKEWPVGKRRRVWEVKVWRKVGSRAVAKRGGREVRDPGKKGEGGKGAAVG